ncbi:MAG: EamA family transporter, partial [Reyranella sp.]
MNPPAAAPRVALLTVLAMLAFASNSILCRLALTSTTIDAASFTAIRLVSGALILVAILRLRGVSPTSGGSWPM